jgi:isocitrate dehydrogenase kinase/phosphatase
MTPPEAIAQAILEGFDRHYRLFRETSAAAKQRWERGDWTSVRDAGRARIDMYDQRVAEAVDTITHAFALVARDESLWSAIKRAYIGLLHEHKQPECAETFYNSVARRVLDRRYYRNEYIFSRPAISTEHLEGQEPTYRCYYPETTDLRATFHEAILAFGLASEFQDLGRDMGFIARAIAEHFPKGWVRDPNFQMHVLRSPFFRNKGAYIVGRVVNGDLTYPFVIPLLKDDAGKVFVDTILLDKRNLARVMSLGRTYFFVDMEVPAAYVEFLQSVVPAKTKTELYTLLGLQKQGKTLFFRDLEHHLKHSTDKFMIAPGVKGMVMVVFTLPSFPYVFKVIRDWFAPPKDADRALVEDRYRFVKLNDRVGRMSDTLEYAHVAFPRSRFDDALVAELQRLAPSCVELDEERIVIKHFYIEGRLYPLDMYVRDVDGERALEAVREYGNAVRELAGANMFPGDLLLKNFGLTRFGRVVFYDYDELCEVTDCRFRHIPRAANDEQEMSAEPFFNVEPSDIFPEQFPTFLFPAGPLREAFMESHRELTDATWWNSQKERLHAGMVQDLFTYPHTMRFSHRFGGAK